MAGALRWALLFSVFVFAAAGVTALWGGFSEGLMKAVISCAIFAITSVALYALSRAR